jgi:hypothetical protein
MCLDEWRKTMKTSVRIKSFVFWDIQPCTPVKVNQCFEGIYCLHLQGSILSRARKQYETDSKQNKFPFGRLHFVMFHKTEIFITTEMRTSNPIQTKIVFDCYCYSQIFQLCEILGGSIS